MPSHDIPVELTLSEVATLREIARYYERSMGRFRYLVRATARSDVRRRFQFVAQESAILQSYADSIFSEMQEENLQRTTVKLAPRALVAFWGRLLASLNARRSRRRLSAEEIERREALADKLADAAAVAARRDASGLERELQTRRPVEAAWMREQLDRRRGDST